MPHKNNLSKPVDCDKLPADKLLGLAMRTYKSITEDEKRQMYNFAAEGINDVYIAEEFDITEETAERCIEDYFIALRQGLGFKVRGFVKYK